MYMYTTESELKEEIIHATGRTMKRRVFVKLPMSYRQDSVRDVP